MDLVQQKADQYKLLMTHYQNFTTAGQEEFYDLAKDNYDFATDNLNNHTLPKIAWLKIRADMVIRIKEDVRRGLYSQAVANTHGWEFVMREWEQREWEQT